MSALDEPCPVCRQPVGEHTVRAMVACSGAGWELPYARVPGNVSFTLDGRDYQAADSVTARSLIFDAPVLGFAGATLLTFETGQADGPPRLVAEVLFIGPAATQRRLGRIVRDAANGTANRVDRARGEA